MEIPVDILGLFATYLDPETFCEYRLVSKKLHKITSNFLTMKQDQVFTSIKKDDITMKSNKVTIQTRNVSEQPLLLAIKYKNLELVKKYASKLSQGSLGNVLTYVYDIKIFDTLFDFIRDSKIFNPPLICIVAGNVHYDPKIGFPLINHILPIIIKEEAWDLYRKLLNYSNLSQGLPACMIYIAFCNKRLDVIEKLLPEINDVNIFNKEYYWESIPDGIELYKLLDSYKIHPKGDIMIPFKIINMRYNLEYIKKLLTEATGKISKIIKLVFRAIEYGETWDILDQLYKQKLLKIDKYTDIPIGTLRYLLKSKLVMFDRLVENVINRDDPKGFYELYNVNNDVLNKLLESGEKIGILKYLISKKTPFTQEQTKLIFKKIQNGAKDILELLLSMDAIKISY